MNIFAKREKPAQNLTFVAIMTAITVAFFAILNFVPFSFLIIILVFPFISFVVGTICKKIYFIPFFFASVLLSLTFSFYDVSNLLFYLVPALITGFIMALLSNVKISIFYQVIAATIVQTILTIAFVPIIELIYEINFIYDIVKLLGLSEHPYINSFIIPFILLLSFIQTFLSYFFIILLSSKLQLQITYKDSKNYFYGGFAAFFGLACFIFAFVKVVEWLNFCLFLLAIYFMVLCLLNIKIKSPLEIIMLVISIITSVVCYVCLYNFIPLPNHVCVASSGIFVYGTYFLINRIILRSK